MFNRIGFIAVTAILAVALASCGTTAMPRDGTAAEGAQATTDVPEAVAGADVSTLAATSPDNYVLGQGDRIAIQVFDEPDLTMQASVGASGIINYSYLGDVQVSGKTPFELEQYITNLLRNGYLVNPAVNVSVVEFRPFFIGGEVRSPGSYPFQPGLNLEKAIALAGGLTDRASQRQMFILRANASSNEQQRISLSDTVGPGETVKRRETFFLWLFAIQ